MKTTALLVCAIVGSASSVVRADVELGGIAGIHVFNKDNGLGVYEISEAPSQANGLTLGVRMGMSITDLLGAEIELGVIPTTARVEGNHYAMQDLVYRAHAIAQFLADDPTQHVIPFVVAGVGAVTIIHSANTTVPKTDYNRYIGSGGTDFDLYVGAGAKYRMSASWGLRVDARLILTPSSEPMSVATVDFEALASAYMTFEFPILVGRPRPRTPESSSAPAPRAVPDDDTDRDGIRGSADMCPNEPEDRDGFQDADGCPEPDNDGDGILDGNDKCPNDPETKNGFQDEDGCPDALPEKLVPFSGVIRGVTFKPGTAMLESGSSAVLDAVVAALVESKHVHLEIESHTDDLPPTVTKKITSNAALSQARADAVKAYLVAKGIEEARVTARGYGEAQPLQDSRSLTGAALDAARARNRRVVFKVSMDDGRP